jgi:heterodisulfide reductase subunit B
MKTTYALFLGCTIPVRLKQYEKASRAVLGKLGIELVGIADFNCCGYPLRNIDRSAFVLSSARNIALAERLGLDVLTLCQCGFGTMRMAAYLLNEDLELKAGINRVLSKENLTYSGRIRIQHLLGVLFRDVGLEAIKARMSRTYSNLKVAAHYGCHALRPSRVMQFDDPVAPSMFDRLVAVTGAESLDWPMKLDCCGGPLKGTDDRMALDFAEKKLEDALEAGARCLTTACPFCQIQFDTVPLRMAFERGGRHYLPSILYPQLLGLCLGLDRTDLGLESNCGDMSPIETCLNDAADAAGSGDKADATPRIMTAAAAV